MRLRNHSRRRAAARAAAPPTSRKVIQTRARKPRVRSAAEAPRSTSNRHQKSPPRGDSNVIECESPASPPHARHEQNVYEVQEDGEFVGGISDEDPLPSVADTRKPLSTSYYCLLQTAFGSEDRIDESNWLTGTLIDLMLWRLATQYTDVHFLATDFCHLHLPSIARKPSSAEAYNIRDVLGRSVECTSTRPIVFVANVGHIHWNLFRVQFAPYAELQLFEPMGRLASRSGISYRSVPRCVVEWLDACYPQSKSWITRSVSAITRPQQVSGFDCGVACLLYADKCGQGQPREAINESTNQHEITSFRSELQRQLQRELSPHEGAC